MNKFVLIAGAPGPCLMGAGGATKKYVAKAIAPVENRVTATKSKNAEQDTALASRPNEIEEVDTSLSPTEEQIASRS